MLLLLSLLVADEDDFSLLEELGGCVSSLDRGVIIRGFSL